MSGFDRLSQAYQTNLPQASSTVYAAHKSRDPTSSFPSKKKGIPMITIRNTQRRYLPSLRHLYRQLDIYRQLLHHPDHSLSLELVTRPRITLLNIRYAHIHESTDILSFPAPHKEHPKVKDLGDLFVCLDDVVKIANLNGVHWKDWLGVTLGHGICHLVGYDHVEGKKEWEEMRKMEKKIVGEMWEKLGRSDLKDHQVLGGYMGEWQDDTAR